MDKITTQKLADLRDILVSNKKHLRAYNTLKDQCQGKPMREYRKAKGKFIERVLKTKI